MIDHLKRLIGEFDESGVMRPLDITIDDDSLAHFAKMRGNPQRFLPSIFDGDWSQIDSHPAPGTARLLRILTDNQGVSRAIVRQGRVLYVYPSF